ncbi:MAG TPA: DUF3987 domain-containing protein [Steroidobacteraceae bacterium]
MLSTALLIGAYKPIPEIANVAAIALFAGVTGRAYRTPTIKDLSMYINLVAESGIGKDAIHTGIPKLLMLSGVPAAPRFLNTDTFASGIALLKMIANTPGLLTLQPEWGRQLLKMNKGDSQAEGLRTKLTEFYAKDYIGGQRYSDAENSFNGVNFPALTFLGETTPGTFRASLTEDMMEDGFLSRFLTVVYEGDRPESQDDDAREVALLPDELERWNAIVKHCLAWAPTYGDTIPSEPPPIVVDVDIEQRRKFIEFEKECDAQYNANKGKPYVQQSWSRAHLKALRLASLCAVADNHIAPCINMEHAAWARQVVRIDQEVFKQHDAAGDVGGDDHARRRKLARFMKEYFTEPVAPSYGIPEDALGRCHSAEIPPDPGAAKASIQHPQAWRNCGAGSNTARHDQLRLYRRD